MCNFSLFLEVPYIVNEFFVQNLGYKIDIQNVTYDYKNKNYSGLNFIIDFN